MKGLATSQIPDLINTTLPHFKDRGRFETAFELQRYYFIQEVFQQDRYVVRDGQSIEWTVVLDDNGTARHVKLYATAQARNRRDVVKLATQRWIYAEAEVYYEAHELTMNRGASRKAKYIKTQYFAGYKSLANLLERRAILSPNDANDDENPHGISWWLSLKPSGVTDYTGAFDGYTCRYGDGTTTTIKGGIDGLINELWANWAANYTGAIDLDTMATMRRGMIFANFVPPTSVKEIFRGPNAKWRILWDLYKQEQYEALVNSGSDNRNGDLSPFKNMITFRGVPTIGLPTLNGAAYSPIYCVNLAHFFPVVHSDWWMKEDEPLRDRDQRHVFVQGIDCQYNYMADNIREAGFTLCTPIS